MHHLLQLYKTAFCAYGFRMILIVIAGISLYSIKQLILVSETPCVPLRYGLNYPLDDW
jgi:hypothetical protein